MPSPLRDWSLDIYILARNYIYASAHIESRHSHLWCGPHEQFERKLRARLASSPSNCVLVFNCAKLVAIVAFITRRRRPSHKIYPSCLLGRVARARVFALNYYPSTLVGFRARAYHSTHLCTQHTAQRACHYYFYYDIIKTRTCTI